MKRVGERKNIADPLKEMLHSYSKQWLWRNVALCQSFVIIMIVLKEYKLYYNYVKLKFIGKRLEGNTQNY